MKYILFLLSLTIFISCCPDNYDGYHKKFVDKVYMNESNRFTFMTNIEGSDETKIWAMSVGSCSCPNSGIHIHRNLPKNERMYVEYIEACMGGYERLDIYVHSLDEIQGGGWNHGKHGSGQTVVVE